MKQKTKVAVSPGMKRPRQAISMGPPVGAPNTQKKKNSDISMTPDTFERSQTRIKNKGMKRRSLNNTYSNNNNKFGNHTQLEFSEGDETMMDVDADETPATLSQISAINPLDNDTLTTTFTHKRKPSQFAADDTWVMAVENARGEPDGAERSFTRKTLSKMNLGDDDNDDDSPEEEDFSEEESATPPKKPKVSKTEKKTPKLKEKKGSLKLPLKQAAKTLKSLKNVGKKEKKEGEKNFKALPDETTVPKTPNQTRKEKKKERKMVKNNFELISTAKKAWEELRRGDLDAAKRKTICDDLMELVIGKVKELTVVHDSARVIQCLVQYGTEAQRTIIYEEIKDAVSELSKSKYAKYVIRKLIHYGSKDLKAQIFKCFHGHVRRLIKHKEASEIIEYAFNEYATAPQRMALLEEFYGPSFIIFKEHSHQTLDQIMSQMPEKKDIVLRNMKEVLLSVIDKELLTHSIIHKVFIDFFSYADEKSKKEVIEGLREHIPHLLHTRDGTRVAMHCVWSGTAKDRKVIVKSLKTHILKICKEEYGHMLLMTIFDSVDDTVLVQKVILDELVKSMNDVAANQHGRKVLAYLMCPRDTCHFHPDISQILSAGDSNASSKKDKDVRSKELKTHISPFLLKYMEQNAANMMTNTHMALLGKAIMTNATGDVRPAMTAIADFVAKPPAEGEMNIVEHPACHIAMKKIIAHDKVRMDAGDGILFSSILLEALPKSTIKMWAASNRGCFMLLSLLEVECPPITEKVTEQLKTVRKSLNKMTFKGADLLLKKLDKPEAGNHKEFRV